MSLAFSRLRGLARAAHPFPLAAVVTLTALIGIVSAEGATDIRKLALLGVAMLLSQLAIGWTNDYLDRERDAAAQPDKPVPSGEVPAGWLPAASVKALAGSFAAGAALGSEALLLLIGGTLCGLVYNAWLKQTPLSWLPYVLALALLPLYVWTALDVYRNDFLWLYAVGTRCRISMPTQGRDGVVSSSVSVERRRWRCWSFVSRCRPCSFCLPLPAWITRPSRSLQRLPAIIRC
jgi:4-hydroxybenzoate polyprenyltransferase